MFSITTCGFRYSLLFIQKKHSTVVISRTVCIVLCDCCYPWHSYFFYSCYSWHSFQNIFLNCVRTKYVFTMVFSHSFAVFPCCYSWHSSNSYCCYSWHSSAAFPVVLRSFSLCRMSETLLLFSAQFPLSFIVILGTIDFLVRAFPRPGRLLFKAQYLFLYCCYSWHTSSCFSFLNSSVYRFFFVGCYAEHSLFPFWLLFIAHFIRILLVVIARTLEFPEQLYCYLLHNAIVNLGLLLLLFAAHHTL